MNLMHGLGEGEAKGIKMVWGKRFLKYEENEDGVEVFFEDGTSAKGDVLVGADGSRSRVREQRTKDIVYPLFFRTFLLPSFPLIFFPPPPFPFSNQIDKIDMSSYQWQTLARPS